jgi:hypothetical protein
MISFKLRRIASFLLLLGFFTLFTHEALPGHAQEQAKDHCRLCEFWAHQAVVEPAPAIFPAPPPVLLVESQAKASRPTHLFEFAPHLRGPPALLQIV